VGQYQEYQKIGKNVQIISNKVPVKIKNKVEGAVVNFKEIEQVIEMEKKIRAELWKKKSVAKYSINDIAGISKKITEAKELVRRFGKFDSNVLIWGETGTGKELFAQSIHNESKRKNEPFYAINCATLPENLLESELFGYAEGSFTGAKKGGKAGLFELAHNGTLFLDEIGDMPLSFQSKLLRALQEKDIRRIGDDKLISVDVRIIAASNKNLYHEVLKGNFREDLYYRIDVMNLKIPPLRERMEDIPYLIEYFMKIYKKEFNSNRNYVFDDNAMNFLKNYMWRGNVRELQNFVERIYIYGNEKKVINEEDVRDLLRVQDNMETLDGPSLNGTLEEIKDNAIKEALKRFDGNRTQAAKYLGVSRSYLWRHLNGVGK
ncbi:MAG: sigma 54-interacting transcriptional regulator, partial [Clostridiales bacterium]|nr:sigma 54-interacting transcriptional regulator [Clostridiales bacterium]